MCFVKWFVNCCCNVQFVREFDIWSVKCIYFSNICGSCLMQKNERRQCILISHKKTGRWHSSVSYHYSSIAQPGSKALIMESFLDVSSALWVYVDSLLFPSHVVRWCVNVLKKNPKQTKTNKKTQPKNCIKPKAEVSKHCKMVPFSEIAVDCIPLTTTYGTEISPAVMYDMSAPLIV